MLRFGALVRFDRIHGPFWSWAVLMFMAIGVAAGCAPAQAPSDATNAQDESRLLARARADIAYLDGPETEGRETASRGFTRTAAYVADQLRAASLQPVLAGEYRLQYPARIRRVVGHEVERVSGDTTRGMRGEDFLLVNVSGSVDTSSPKGLPSIPGVIWNSEMSEEEAEASWQVKLEVDDRATTAPMHVAGMIPGADPRQRDSLVVWMAPLDASGLQGDQSWTDGSDLSIPAAALLSAARQTSNLQGSWSPFPHSIMVLFVSGTRDDCQGGEWLTRHIPWDRSMISRMVVVDIASGSGCDWTSLWSESISELDVLETNNPFKEDGAFGFGSWRPRSEVQRPDSLDAATVEALRLSREFLARLP